MAKKASDLNNIWKDKKIHVIINMKRGALWI